MNILVVCHWGKNRSKYLASYLQQTGYNVQYGGVIPESENRITQEMVSWSEYVIFVHPNIQKEFSQYFKINNQECITLNVEDRVAVLAPTQGERTDMEWIKMQEEYVYPELERQIKKYLPVFKNTSHNSK